MYTINHQWGRNVEQSPIVKGRVQLGEFDLFPYEIPLRRPYRWAKGEHIVRYGALVRLRRDGVEGWGEIAPPPHEMFSAVELRSKLATLPRQLPTCFAELGTIDSVYPRVRCGIASAVVAWEAAVARTSIARWLANRMGRVPADMIPVNALVTGGTESEVLEETERYLAAGFSTLKVKCGPDIERDLLRVASIRRSAPHVTIRLDANEAWDPATVLSTLERFARLRIEYVEQPVPAALGVQFFAKLRRESPLPIAVDELGANLESLQAIVDAGAADVVILKTQRLGGPDRMLAALQLLEVARLKAVVTSSLESSVGTSIGLSIASLLPPPIPPCGFGISSYLAEDFFQMPPLQGGFSPLF